MIISLYPKPTKCYGDTVIRRQRQCVFPCIVLTPSEP